MTKANTGTGTKRGRGKSNETKGVKKACFSGVFGGASQLIRVVLCHKQSLHTHLR